MCNMCNVNRSCYSCNQSTQYICRDSCGNIHVCGNLLGNTSETTNAPTPTMLGCGNQRNCCGCNYGNCGGCNGGFVNAATQNNGFTNNYDEYYARQYGLCGVRRCGCNWTI